MALASKWTDPKATVNALDVDPDEAGGEWSCVGKKKGRNKVVGELKAQVADEPPVDAPSAALDTQQSIVIARKVDLASGGYAKGANTDPPWRRAQAGISAPPVEQPPPAPVVDRWAALDRTVRKSERTPTPPPAKIVESKTLLEQRPPLAPPWLKQRQRSSSDHSDQSPPSTPLKADMLEVSSSIKERMPPQPTTDRWAALDPAVRWPGQDTGNQRSNHKYSPKFKAVSPKLKPEASPNLLPTNGNSENPRRARDDVNDEIVRVLDLEDCMLKRGDFGARSVQFLHAIHQKGGRPKVHEALDSVFALTKTKNRETIMNWSGYVAKLLQKFFDDLAEELQELRKASIENIVPSASETSLSEKLASPTGARLPLFPIGISTSTPSTDDF